jgi:hypothetical protein
MPKADPARILINKEIDGVFSDDPHQPSRSD